MRAIEGRVRVREIPEEQREWEESRNRVERSRVGVRLSTRSGGPREECRDIARETMKTGRQVGKNGNAVTRRCQPHCEASTVEMKERSSMRME